MKFKLKSKLFGFQFKIQIEINTCGFQIEIQIELKTILVFNSKFKFILLTMFNIVQIQSAHGL